MSQKTGEGAMAEASQQNNTSRGSSAPNGHGDVAPSGKDASWVEDITTEVLKEANIGAKLDKSHARTLSELRNKYAIDLLTTPKPQPIALEVIGKKHNAPIAIYGAVTLVTAKAKSGKTYAHSILVSALVKGGDLFGRIRPHFIVDAPERRKVAVFLTEESQYDSHRVGRRIMKLAEVDAVENVEIWRLRTEPNDIKKQIIHQVLYEDAGLCAAVIDGGRDTVFDINSSEESCNAWTDLIRWADELGIAIIVILHQNKDNSNARGHYGTEGKNKSEIIVNVSKDREAGTFIIEAEDSRSIEFEPITFKIDDDGVPYLADDQNKNLDADGKGKKSILPHQYPHEFHAKILTAIKQSVERPSYSELCTQIKLQFQVHGIVFGNNKAVEFCTHYKNLGWAKENEAKVAGERSTTYSIHPPL